MLIGDTADLPPGLARLSTAGLLRHEQPEVLERWIDAAADAGLIALSADRYRILSLTERGREVMAGRVECSAIRAPLRSAEVSSWRELRGHSGMFQPRRRFFDV